MDLCGRRRRHLYGLGVGQHSGHGEPSGRWDRHVHVDGNAFGLGHRHVGEYGDGRAASRCHRSGSGKQRVDGHRHHHTDRRSLDHQDRRRDHAMPGALVTYTIVASNAGPSVVTGATVTDTLPASSDRPTWTCVGAGGGTCPASGSAISAPPSICPWRRRSRSPFRDPVPGGDRHAHQHRHRSAPPASPTPPPVTIPPPTPTPSHQPPTSRSPRPTARPPPRRAPWSPTPSSQ